MQYTNKNQLKNELSLQRRLKVGEFINSITIHTHTLKKCNSKLRSNMIFCCLNRSSLYFSVIFCLGRLLQNYVQISFFVFQYFHTYAISYSSCYFSLYLMMSSFFLRSLFVCVYLIVLRCSSLSILPSPSNLSVD